MLLPARFVVHICSMRRDRPVAIAHGFKYKARAEEFALAVSHFFDPPVNGVPTHWAAVEAVAIDRQTARAFGLTYSYLTVDAGGRKVAERPIPAGFHGSPRVSAVRVEAAT